jgi:predicted glycoside hydrolase/deacetylase ChbG (UPF0249 family)
MRGFPGLQITADDLGYSSSRDAGIFYLFSIGAITRASLLLNGATARGALSRAHAVGLPVGLHLNLTEGAPLSAPPTSLLPPGGTCMRGKLGFRAALAARAVCFADVAREAAAQAAAFTALHPAGAAPAHLDGHQHVHVLPGVAAAVAGALAGRVGGVVRLPVWAGEGVDPLRGVVGGAEGGVVEEGGLQRAEFYRAVSADAEGAAAVYAEAGFKPSAAVFAGFSLSPETGAAHGAVERHRAALERVLRAAWSASQRLGSAGCASPVELMVHPGWRTLAPGAPPPLAPLHPSLPPPLEGLRAGALKAAGDDEAGGSGGGGGCCACCGADVFSQCAAREVELAALAALVAAGL